LEKDVERCRSNVEETNEIARYTKKYMLNRVLDQTITLSKAHKVFNFSVLGEIAKALGETIQISDSEKKKSVKSVKRELLSFYRDWKEVIVLLLLQKWRMIEGIEVTIEKRVTMTVKSSLLHGMHGCFKKLPSFSHIRHSVENGTFCGVIC
jgi:hypothetical protein